MEAAAESLEEIREALKPEDKKAIVKSSYNMGYTYFESWINSISFVKFQK